MGGQADLSYLPISSSLTMSTAGAVRLGGVLKELRIHLCQTSPASKGVRTFIENHYVELKKANPRFPILIRECSGVLPQITARYAMGVEQSRALSDLDDKATLWCCVLVCVVVCCCVCCVCCVHCMCCL